MLGRDHRLVVRVRNQLRGSRANWQRINVAVHNALSEITLADMAFPGTAELVLIARSSEEAERMRTAGPPGNDVH